MPVDLASPEGYCEQMQDDFDDDVEDMIDADATVRMNVSKRKLGRSIQPSCSLPLGAKRACCTVCQTIECPSKISSPSTPSRQRCLTCALEQLEHCQRHRRRG